MATEKLLAILSKDEKAEKAAEIQRVVKRAEMGLNADILRAEELVEDAENELSNALKSKSFDPARVINAKRAIVDRKADLEDLKALKAELF